MLAAFITSYKLVTLGGPLIYQFNKDNNQYLLAGIVSAGSGCARRSKQITNI